MTFIFLIDCGGQRDCEWWRRSKNMVTLFGEPFALKWIFFFFREAKREQQLSSHFLKRLRNVVFINSCVRLIVWAHIIPMAYIHLFSVIGSWLLNWFHQRMGGVTLLASNRAYRRNKSDITSDTEGREPGIATHSSWQEGFRLHQIPEMENGCNERKWTFRIWAPGKTDQPAYVRNQMSLLCCPMPYQWHKISFYGRSSLPAA